MPSDFRNFPTPHCHIQSLDSGSTPKAFIDREKELGTGVVTCTDHGTLSATRTVYSLAQKAKMTPILGVEAYFRDDNCPILKAAGIEDIKAYNKYYHITLHALNQTSYEALIRVLSRTWLNPARVERHGREEKPLFVWSDLEELGQHDITMTSGCLVGMVQRHLSNYGGEPRIDLAIAYYERLRTICKPGNFYVEVFPHKCDTYWASGCFFTIKGREDRQRYWNGKNLLVQIGSKEPQKTTAETLVTLIQAGKVAPTDSIKIVRVMNQRKWEDVEPMEVLNGEIVQGFLKNECTQLSPDGDVQKTANHFLRLLAAKYHDPILISDDSHFAHPDEKIVQDIRLMSNPMDNWHFADSYHRKSSEEAFAHFNATLGIGADEFGSWVENNVAWAQRFKDFKLKPHKTLPANFYPTDTIAYLFELIKKHGRFDGSPAQVQRLQAEIKMLHDNGVEDLLPYFFLAEDVTNKYEVEHWGLTGPGRGSAAGMLTAYLLDITHVDPLRYELSNDRFLTMDRIQAGKKPDIDMDFPDREPLTDPTKGYLKQKFGENFCQISTDGKLRLKSSILDVHRTLDGNIPKDVSQLTASLDIPPQGIEDVDWVFGYEDPTTGMHVDGLIETDQRLADYAKKYPKQWEVVQKCLGVTRQKGRHASAYVIANRPVWEFIPMELVSDVPCTSYTMNAVEEAGAWKMDFLGLNTLYDIGTCIQLIQKTDVWYVDGTKREWKEASINGRRVPAIRQIPTSEGIRDIWDLPEDQNVFRQICEGKTETVFQFNTDQAKMWYHLFWKDNDHLLRSIEDLSAFTALDRPGPLDAFVGEGDDRRNMLAEFAARARGEEPIGANPILDKMFPETYGVIVYQEQLQKAFQTIGKTTGIEADHFRQRIGKKKLQEVLEKDYPVFMRGARETVGEEEAQRLWKMLETFGQYGFNKSHSVSYAIIGYACAYLKYYFPLDWWCAVLRNADRQKVTGKFWNYVKDVLDVPDVALSGSEYEVQGQRIRAPFSLLKGIGEVTHNELIELRPFRDINEFCQKVEARRIANATTDEKGKKRKGRTTLGTALVTKLIISGTFDSLFPKDTNIYDKLTMYTEAKRVAEGANKPEKIHSSFLNVPTVVRYLMRKSILPAYVEDLRPYAIVKKLATEKTALLDGNPVWLVNGEQLAREVANDIPMDLAAVGYVIEVKPFWKGRALKYQIEVDGERFEFNHWPPKETPPEKKMEAPEGVTNGSIVLVYLNRYKSDKPFTIRDIVLVQEALGKETK